MPASRAFITLVALAELFSPFASAHTWIEQYQVIGPNGSYIGDNGYSRGYVARTDPTFEGDENILWMLPELSAREPNGDVRNRINSSDPLCHPNQRTANYTNPEYPKLKVAPGNYVAMKYYENGHVTLPWNQPGKPQMGGTAFVFATTDPIEDEMLANVMKWTPDGKGGDGRGFLLAAQNFDDGRCHQINDCVLSAERQVLFANHVTGTNISAELWCETDIQIPTTQKAGSTLTTYWVWQWPTEAGASCIYPDGKDEYYTTCADFDIVDGGNDDANIMAEVVSNTLLQPDYQSTAVSTFASRTALTTSPSVTLDDWSAFSAQATQSTSLPANFTSACAVSAQIAAAAASAGQTAALPPSCPADKWATGALFAEISASAVRYADASSSAALPATTTGSAMTSALPSSSYAATSSSSPPPSAAAPASSFASAASTSLPSQPASPAAASSSAASEAPGSAAPAATTVVSVSTLTEIFTVTVVPVSTSAPGTALSSAASDVPSAPVVGAGGVVEDAVAASMSEHCAKQRTHARHFRG